MLFVLFGWRIRWKKKMITFREDRIFDIFVSHLTLSVVYLCVQNQVRKRWKMFKKFGRLSILSITCLHSFYLLTKHRRFWFFFVSYGGTSQNQYYSRTTFSWFPYMAIDNPFVLRKYSSMVRPLIKHIAWLCYYWTIDVCVVRHFWWNTHDRHVTSWPSS